MCELCDNEYLFVGGVYTLTIFGGGICESCGASYHQNTKNAKYIGLECGSHQFVYLRSFKCPECGMRMRYGSIPCGNDNALVEELFGEIPVRVL